MKRKCTVLLVVSLLFALFAAPSFGYAATTPAHAKTAVSGPAVIPLGSAWTRDGKLVEGYAIIHFRQTPSGRPVGADAKDRPGRPNPKASNLYEFLASGARWRVTEPYVLNASNGSGLAAEAVLGDVTTSMATWESEAGFDIFGAVATTTDPLSAEGAGDVPDGRNEVMFEQLGSTGVLAYASVWGIWTGRPSSREIVECDVVFNDSEPWGDAGPTSETALGNTSVYDLLNIATHELGHAAGLADLYTEAASEQTMYGYSTLGETKKRTLGEGDIAGIRALY